jgi:hypothetical protein
MDPQPGGPKTCGSGFRSGSGTLILTMLLSFGSPFFLHLRSPLPPLFPFCLGPFLILVMSPAVERYWVCLVGVPPYWRNT